MKRIKNMIFATVIALLMMSCVYISFNNYNLQQEKASKGAQIVQLKELNLLNSELLKAKDSIILVKEKNILALKDQIEEVKHSTKNNTTLGFTLGDKSISTEELLTIFNKTYHENEANKAILESIRKNFGISTKRDEKTISAMIDSNSIINQLTASETAKVSKIKELVKENDQLEVKAKALELIERRFNIKYQFDGKTITVPLNRIDTLLDFYPLIKDKMRYNKDGNKIWLKSIF